MSVKLQASKDSARGSESQRGDSSSRGFGRIILKYYIRARHPTTSQFMRATVLMTQASIEAPRDAPPKEKMKYYVRFEDEDKRNDCWLPYSEIEETKEKVVKKNMSQTYANWQQKHENDNPQYSISFEDYQLHEQITKIKKIQRIQLGQFLIDTWYTSPYRPQFNGIGTLFICEYCFRPYHTIEGLQDHDQTCSFMHPPGDQIYRDMQRSISIFQVDGAQQQEYCNNLGLIAKLFLDHKGLKLQMKSFLFYILCEIKDNNFHFVGFFSKSKHVPKQNLSCILILPSCLRKGYGRLLIDFSYQLSLIDKEVGSPEKPLSDMGRKAYLSYWAQIITDVLIPLKRKQASLQSLVSVTSISAEDIEWTASKCDYINITAGMISVKSDQKSLAEMKKVVGRPVDKIDTRLIHYVKFDRHKYYSLGDQMQLKRQQ